MNYLKIILSLVILLTGITSCNYYENQKKTEINSSYELIEIEHLENYDRAEIETVILELNQRAPKWWKKVKKWFKDHTGTHLFQNCNGTGNCGPCAGICLTVNGISSENIDNNIISEEDLQLGFRVYSISILENQFTGQEKLMFEFKHNNDFTINNQFYIVEETELSQGMLEVLNKESIIIRPGIYPVVYSSNSNVGQTIVDAQIY